MTTKSVIATIAVLGLSLSVGPSQAADISLQESAFNRDGVVTNPGVPAGVDDSLFNYGSGLGTIQTTIGTAGGHFVGLFVDHEIDEAINTFFNEYGAPVNTPALIQTWEIDEPGFGPPFGDIYDHFLASNSGASALENANGVPSTTPNDVSMAIGWNVNVPAGQHAIITFVLSDTTPSAGFYLEHTDPDSAAAIYFSSSAQIVGGPAVPDGGATLPLLLAGLASLGLVAARWRIS